MTTRKPALKATDTHCKHGHQWDQNNNLIIVKASGSRQCRTCKQEAQKRSREHYKKPTTFQHYRQG
jgi:hypothetical protein